MSYRYRAALVTGASSGIGRALSLGLAAQGSLVVACARRLHLLEELVEEVRRGGGRARAVKLDVADTEATVDVIRRIDDELGLDLVVANAGVGVTDRTKAPYTWEAMAGACHINFCGAAATLTAVLPRWVERGSGHLVGMSSLASLGPLPESVAYCAPKAGLSMLLECLRLDLQPKGVDVTTVHVGFVRTTMTQRSQHPMPWLMDPEQAAKRILRLLPDAPATIDFPVPLYLAARGVAAMPRRLRSWVLRRRLLSGSDQGE